MTEETGAPIAVVEGEALAAVTSLWRKTGRELRARFAGSSMEPALSPGSEVLLRCGEPGTPGDVIAFVADGRLVVHRVVARARDGRWTLTRGDARVLPDVPILDADDILGRVAGVWREGSLHDVAPRSDSPLRRLVLRVACAAMGVDRRAGMGMLRSAHALARLTRSALIFVARRSAAR